MSYKKSALVLFGVLFLIIDQITKFCVIKYYPEYVSYNDGIFFGSVDNNMLLILFLILGVFILGYLYIKSPEKSLLPLTLIASGAVSNILDRFFHKGVVDYINIELWSNFNLADVYIVIGALWYLWIVFRQVKTKY